jgi:hypothetical protein
MSRPPLYPKGATQMNVHIPLTIRDGLRSVAGRQHQSVSQLVCIILEDWLRHRGELPLPDREEAAV